MAAKDVSTMKIAPKVWKNGEFVEWDDAQIHVMSHVVNYGSSVFEGIRCYETSKGSAIFRLPRCLRHAANIPRTMARARARSPRPRYRSRWIARVGQNHQENTTRHPRE